MEIMKGVYNSNDSLSRSELSMDSPWARAYLRHYARYFGKPFDVEMYHFATGMPLRLATYDLRYRKFRVYASIGMAEEVKDGPGEVILLSDDFSKDVPVIFINSLFFVLDKKIPLGSRFAVAGVDSVNPDFAEHYEKVAIYYSTADGFDEGFGKVECSGETGEVYQGIFIAGTELDYLRRKGPEAFETAFRKQDAELCSVRRAPCV
jgi:hypothetical protein